VDCFDRAAHGVEGVKVGLVTYICFQAYFFFSMPRVFHFVFCQSEFEAGAIGNCSFCFCCL
jgi:hypothetical protein